MTANPFTPSLIRQCANFKHQNDSCTFVSKVDECQPDGGFINYLKLPFCVFEGKEAPAIVMLILWLVILFIALGITAEE